LCNVDVTHTTRTTLFPYTTLFRSEHEPTFVEMTYQGNPDKPLVALVGKGVTFDTGGISLKRGRHLSDMRMDMGGAYHLNDVRIRSEEHTSELQSRFDLVCRLLVEK